MLCGCPILKALIIPPDNPISTQYQLNRNISNTSHELRDPRIELPTLSHIINIPLVPLLM